MQHFLPEIYQYRSTVKDGLGYDIAVSTDGYGEDSQGNPKTTSIIVIDGAMSKHGEEVNYYTGYVILTIF